MAVKYLKDGQGFGPEHFSQDFGFKGSAEGAPKKFADGGPAYAEGGENEDAGPSSESPHAFAKGGDVHPNGHHVIHVEHHADGAVVHHHAHGGYTVHHADGGITHHMQDGMPCHARGGIEHMHDSSELAHRHKGKHHSEAGESAAEEAAESPAEEAAEGGMARGGHMRLPKSFRPKAGHGHEIGNESAVNRPPRNPMTSTTPRNAMPGGQMAYGVEPSAEPDVAGSTQGIPQLKRGGRRKHEG